MTTQQTSPGRSNINLKIANAGLTSNDAEAGSGGASGDGNGANTAGSKPASMASTTGAEAAQSAPANQGIRTEARRASGGGGGGGGGGGVSDAFLEAIYNAEQGGKVGGNRNPAEQGPGTTKGKYQITDETLRSIGWKDAKGKWTGEAEKHGIKND